MKKLLGLSMMLALTLLVAATTLAAVHNYTDDLVNPFLMPDYSMALKFEDWYYIEKNGPKITLDATFPKDFRYKYYGFEYYQNEHNFLNLTYIDHDKYDDSTQFYFKGCYLFENGLFAGFDSGNFDYGVDDINDGTQNIVISGYRFNLPNQAGYIAASIDYALNNDYLRYGDSGLIDYELDAKYYTDQSRVYGQLIIPNKNMEMVGNDKTFLKLGIAYKISDNFVVGANYLQFVTYIVDCDDDYGDFDIVRSKYIEYDFGFTAELNKLGIELQHKILNIDYYNHDSYTTRMNLLYSFTNNCRAGFEVRKEENNDELYRTAKLKCLISGQNAIIVMHTLKNDFSSEGAVSYIGCDIKL
ncbi:MAG: hypothetical protein PVG90_11075 [Bacillota bacterium]|jgi:hypothetical protein